MVLQLKTLAVIAPSNAAQLLWTPLTRNMLSLRRLDEKNLDTLMIFWLHDTAVRLRSIACS
jgi:hypothetical protein